MMFTRQTIRTGLQTVVVALTLATRAIAAVPEARIAAFAGDRSAAISYTFDDGLRDQYTLAVPMLDEFGFKGTFFVIPARTAATPEEGEKNDANEKRNWGGISWPELKKMSDAGHEIASHSWSHPNLKNLPAAEVETQFDQAYDEIEKQIGKPPLTLAFPFNASTPEIEAAAMKRHAACRTFQTATGDKSTVASLNAWADKLVADKKWGVMMVHGVARGYAALTDPEIFRTHLRHVKDRDADVWVDTFANVARYVRERDDAVLVVQAAAAGNGVTCVLKGTLDRQRHDVPLTVVIAKPDVKSAKAERAGKSLPVRVGDGAIQVDVAPDAEPFTVTWE